ncbi:nucleoside phosphorylase [Microbacterium testaceum]|uniref:5'-methylthioadenosine/S-adenosylhomocysteine nucleosidase family protein n=1 Tax=Microbacterium testaceum TaxID=2033 RepID=UPI0027886616|nr:5'-methylthioadenosine/S-adenosylhomocysteine nucleosidase [Microbacterium testaceum]MDQ1173416.1 nucleoside phosphorylase [Microbacterium testaceum]
MTEAAERSIVKTLTQMCRARGMRDGTVLLDVLVRAHRDSVNVAPSDVPDEFSLPNGLSKGKAADFANEILSAAGAKVSGKRGELLPMVMIVTALPLEADAVAEYLDAIREVEHPTTGSLYQVGRFPGPPAFDVAVVVTAPGNESAAMETERAIHQFHPTIALFVGVAGGVKDDVAVGDVVAADYVYDYSSAKEGEGFIHARVKTAKATYAAIQRARVVASTKAWVAVVKRDSPTSDSGEPAALIKPIAAGPRLLASTGAPTALWIKEHANDALAVEMEGYGFHAALSAYPDIEAIVVRGISDVVDGKSAQSDKAWQPVAASRAAAFALTVAAGLVRSAEAKRSSR